MKSEEPKIDVSKEKLSELYEKIVKIRLFEEKAFELFSQNEIYGSVHFYTGEEAVAAGVCSALREEDYVTSTHRGHGHCIGKGADVKLMMAELLGRKTGYCKGKGGSMHITDFKKGILGAVGIVGSGIPIALGAALSSLFRKTNQVAACFFGDGAINNGVFHESLNFAVIWNLPVIFVCENNLYAMSTRISRMSSQENIAERVSGYGLTRKIVDGMDVVEVYKAALSAVENTRKGEGPSFLECKTYRYRGHSRHDPATYRPEQEVAEWKKRDPIEVFKTGRYLNISELGVIEEKASKEIEEAVKFARESPFPNPEESLEHVFL